MADIEIARLTTGKLYASESCARDRRRWYLSICRLLEEVQGYLADIATQQGGK